MALGGIELLAGHRYIPFVGDIETIILVVACSFDIKTLQMVMDCDYMYPFASRLRHRSIPYEVGTRGTVLHVRSF